MRFFQDSDLEIPVRWYFCAPGAKVFPGYTRFASGNWAPDKVDWSGPGEASWRPRDWSDGQPPGPDPIVRRSTTGLTAGGGTHFFTSAQPITLHKDQTVLVYIWSYLINGFGVITGVSDLAGNVYRQDFDRQGIVDTKVRLTVWRARHSGAPIISPLTVLFAGSQLFITFAGIAYEGLRNQAPLQTMGNTGLASHNPFVGPLSEGHFSRLVFATFSCGAMSALASVLPGFLNLGSEISNGSLEDGNACEQIQHVKLVRKILSWQATVNYEWVAAVLVYEGEQKFTPPGQTFCGPLDTWANGADSTNYVPLNADQYGVALCCATNGPPLFGLTCDNVHGNLLCTITWIYNHGATSLTFVGQTLRLIPLGLQWVVDATQFSQVAPFWQGFLVSCNSEVFTLLSIGAFPVLFTAVSQYQSPPGIVFWNIFPFPQVDPNNGLEQWDVVITLAN